MNLEDAMRNIENVVAAFNGNLKAHEALQASLQIIRNNLPKPPDPAPEPPK